MKTSSMLKMKISFFFSPSKNKLKNNVLHHFHHTPDIFANVTSQILHGRANFHMLFLQKVWTTLYLRPISFFKKYLKINEKHWCFWLFSWNFCIAQINYFFMISWRIFHHFLPRNTHFLSKIDNSESFLLLIIVFGSKFLKTGHMDFETSFLKSPFLVTKMKF